SGRVLMTSPDLRRIFSASSPTVTDSGTRISSRLTSAGGAGAASMTVAAPAGRAGPTGAAGAAGAAGCWGLAAAGGAAGRGGAGVTRGRATGPVGCRNGRDADAGCAGRSRGRKGTILGSGFFTCGAEGGGAAAAAGLTAVCGSATGAMEAGAGA